jgi:hypothetical protein
MKCKFWENVKLEKLKYCMLKYDSSYVHLARTLQESAEN